MEIKVEKLVQYVSYYIGFKNNNFRFILIVLGVYEYITSDI